MRVQYLKFSFIVPKKGLRFHTAKLVDGKSQDILFEKNGFILYVAGFDDELRICVPKRGRLLRRFLRDYSKSQGGLPRSVDFWFNPFK